MNEREKETERESRIVTSLDWIENERSSPERETSPLQAKMKDSQRQIAENSTFLWMRNCCSEGRRPVTKRRSLLFCLCLRCAMKNSLSILLFCAAVPTIFLPLNKLASTKPVFNHKCVSKFVYSLLFFYLNQTQKRFGLESQLFWEAIKHGVHSVKWLVGV